jgi:N-acetylmuramoyl-L-alanine amidase
MRVMSKAEWRRRRRRKVYMVRAAVFISLLAVIGLLLFGAVKLVRNLIFREEIGTWEAAGDVPIQASLLTPNDYSRSQAPLKQVNGVIIHFVGNAGSSAVSNRNYFEQLKLLKQTSACAHFIVGLDGEIIQCIPVNEVAYASAERNEDTIAIEYCHTDTDGTPNEETYASLVKLTAEVCIRFSLTEEDILRHYDINGRDCPIYYVDNPEEWLQLKQDVMAIVNAGK